MTKHDVLILKHHRFFSAFLLTYGLSTRKRYFTLSNQFNTKWSVPPRLISNKCESLWRLQSKQAAKNNSCSDALNSKGQLSLLIRLNVSEAVATISQLPVCKIMWGWTWLSLLQSASHLYPFHKSADLQCPTGHWDVSSLKDFSRSQ